MDYWLASSSRLVQAPAHRGVLSQECDIYPKNRPETVGLIQTKLGRGSRFARKQGFYVNAVAPEIATLPDGWERRLKRMPMGKVTALCLDLHDVLVSKLAAGRLKDLELIGALLKSKTASASIMSRRISTLPPSEDQAHLRLLLKGIKENC